MDESPAYDPGPLVGDLIEVAANRRRSFLASEVAAHFGTDVARVTEILLRLDAIGVVSAVRLEGDEAIVVVRERPMTASEAIGRAYGRIELNEPLVY